MSIGLSEGFTREEVLEMDLADLRNLNPSDFERRITEAEISHIFRACDALWLHNGDPKAPHAELTAGDHSNGFVNTLRVLRYTNFCAIFADQLLDLLPHPLIAPMEWIVGSDHASATLSYACAAILGAQHDFTEKEGKKQVWKRFEIQLGEAVLQVEELVTTTSTLQAVRDGIREGNASQVTFLPFVLALVHRSPVFEFEGGPILHLVHYEIQTWEPSECPLCAAGSEAIRPKQNWAKLVGGR